MKLLVLSVVLGILLGALIGLSLPTFPAMGSHNLTILGLRR